MGIFKRKQPFDEQDFIAQISQEDEIYKASLLRAEQNRRLRPDSLTADEITGKADSENAESENKALDPLTELKNKMLAGGEPQKEVEQAFFTINTELFTDTDEDAQLEEPPLLVTAENDLNLAEEIYFPEAEEPQPYEDDLFKTVDAANTPEITVFSPITQDEPEETTVEEISVLQDCMPFITDEDGNYNDNEPLYKLDSVEEILGIEIKEEALSATEPTIAALPDNPEGTIIFEMPLGDKKAQISDIDPTENEDVPVITVPDENTHTMPVVLFPETAAEQTIQAPKPAIFPTDTETVGELFDEKDGFTPKQEYKNKKDAKKFRIMLLKKRKSCFLSMIASVFAFIITLLLGTSYIFGGTFSSSGFTAVMLVIMTAISVAANIHTFASFASVLEKRVKTDCINAFSMLATFFAIIICLVNDIDTVAIYPLMLLCCTDNAFRSVLCFKKSDYIFRNFCKICGKGSAHAVTLIDDTPTVFSMAHRAIDGDVLVAASQKTGFIKNFMRSTYGDRDLSGKAGIMLIVNIVLSGAVFAAVSVFYDSFVSGAIAFGFAAALLNPLLSIGCEILPLAACAHHLGRYNSMLAGLKGANLIAEANALAVDCNAIFPRGTVKLCDMKILNPIEVEYMIAAACAITEQAESPLGPVFRKITETNASVEIPIADSIRYEEGIGITGWVGDHRILIGGRTMMNAHEIDIPEKQIDKQILIDGCFPTYLACDGKAVALLSIKYIPEKHIVKELQRITGMGITLLVKNCDQNLSEAMLCDYFDLYEDSLKLMNGSGVHMYDLAVSEKPKVSSPAATHGSLAGLAAVLFCANRAKRANTILSICYIVAAVLGIIYFAYRVFASPTILSTGLSVLYFKLISFVISYIAYLFSKP